MAFTLQRYLTDVQTRLAGLANAFTQQQLISFINEGKDELWEAFITSADDYFVQSTTTTAGQTNTLATLSTTTREYTLPSDCLAPRFIECVTPGFEYIRFVYRKITHPDFQEQRRSATQSGSDASSLTFQTYYYTIVGKNTIMFAAFPETAFTIKVWYVRALPDLVNLGDALDEMVQPLARRITDYVVKQIQLIKDPNAWVAWKEDWKDKIALTVEAASPRDETTPTFSIEYDDLGGF